VAAPRWNVTVRKSSHASTCVIEFPQLQVTVRKVSDDAPDLVAESVVTERERETFTIRLVENNAFDIHYKKWSSQFTGGSLDLQDPCYSLFDEVMIIMDDEVSEGPAVESLPDAPIAAPKVRLKWEEGKLADGTTKSLVVNTKRLEHGAGLFDWIKRVGALLKVRGVIGAQSIRMYQTAPVGNTQLTVDLGGYRLVLDREESLEE
ncbi:hypothetical protein FOZ63_003030, partial [Perkinsus olseni]